MANETLVGWVGSQSGRDTGSLISSCVLTMGLCVWSALHLNIAKRGETFFRQWYVNILWVGTGIFGPELVALAAFRQFASATALISAIRKLDADKQYVKKTLSAAPTGEADENQLNTILSSEAEVYYEWKMIHGFYAAMGGFAIEIDDELEALLKTGLETRRLTITPHGIHLLAKCGLLPVISADEIEDKSKADSIAKTIVVVQATWFLIQTISRVAYGLPVTLLEVNTVGHVVCAFLIYALWWHKPREIREPTLLRGPWTRGMIAYMWMSSKISDSTSTENTVKYLFSGFKPVPEFARVSFNINVNSDATEKDVEKHASSAITAGLPTARQPSQTPLDQLPPLNDDWAELDRTFVGTPEQKWRWKVAMHAVRQFSAISERLNDGPRVRRTSTVLDDMTATARIESSPIKCDEDLCCEFASNWAYPGLMLSYTTPIGVILWFGTIIYGAVHAAAWNDYFPTRAERICWHTAVGDILGSGLLWTGLTLWSQCSKWFERLWNRVQDRQANRWLYYFLAVICSLCGLFYILSRGYLVVESFVSLRRLPSACYDTPDWTSKIPHFGAG